MAYKKIKSYNMTEAELRQRWHDEYCAAEVIVETFDGIVVKFFPEMFDHAFYESDNRKKADKSILSYNRCEKMLWIKDTLQDAEATLKQGWLKSEKRYDNSRRVAVIKGNYVVVISIFRENKARFITAYQIDNNDKLEEMLGGPDWAKKKNAD